MYRARGDKVALPCLYLVEIEKIGKRVGLYRFLELLGGYGVLKSKINARALVGFNYVPHLGLAKAVLVLECVRIRGVHLHRKVLARVYKLYKRREKREVAAVCADLVSGERFRDK